MDIFTGAIASWILSMFCFGCSCDPTGPWAGVTFSCDLLPSHSFCISVAIPSCCTPTMPLRSSISLEIGLSESLLLASSFVTAVTIPSSMKFTYGLLSMDDSNEVLRFNNLYLLPMHAGAIM
ncbi:Os05g0432650 [Oryza sativa Japonica Group]|uniref:Os05g0432650 protein n=1 Tax=Oryza sativa subsp. japonica TaxID=39947 RepID=A0A0P0WMS1_ORYSJ|nr:hypothetical protein EE612_029691 [Oryza sativa]BAS94174.1 Os05g0432650 [Oryza sativa Japonica Group]